MDNGQHQNSLLYEEQLYPLETTICHTRKEK